MTSGQCTTTEQGGFKKCFSWSAAIAGAFVGIGLAFLLNVFNVAIGLSLVTTTKEGMMTFAIGGFLGIAIGTIVSMFMAGYTSGRLGRSCCPKHNLGVLYGFVAWCVALILMIMLAANMTRYVAFYTDFVAHSATVVVSADKPAVASKSAVAPKTVAKTAAAVAKSSGADVQGTMNSLGKISLLVFALFFIGAVSSCFGGHCGMTGCRKDEGCTR